VRNGEKAELDKRLLEEAKSNTLLAQARQLSQDYVNELNAFLSSLVNGLPLVYYTFYPHVNFLENLLSAR
jgi:hypothetical protein